MRNKYPAFNLDSEETALLASLEAGEWHSVDNFNEEKTKAEVAAVDFLRKDIRINIRLSKGDLSRLQRQAAYEGMPCQTLMGSILHKYAAGHLIEATTNNN